MYINVLIQEMCEWLACQLWNWVADMCVGYGDDLSRVSGLSPERETSE